MNRFTPFLCVLLSTGAIVDRVAVKVGKLVITTSAIEEQERIASYLNGEAVDLSAANRRRTAERLIEQLLIRREMEISRYPMPSEKDVEPMVADALKARGDPAKAGISEAALRRSLSLQVATLRFIELRFRPGSSVGDGEAELYYRDEFVPEWEKTGKSAPPELDDVRDKIEAIVLQRKVNQALDQWLKDARTLTRIQYFEEAFL